MPYYLENLMPTRSLLEKIKNKNAQNSKNDSLRKLFFLSTKLFPSSSGRLHKNSFSRQASQNSFSRQAFTNNFFPIDAFGSDGMLRQGHLSGFDICPLIHTHILLGQALTGRPVHSLEPWSKVSWSPFQGSSWSSCPSAVRGCACFVGCRLGRFGA